MDLKVADTLKVVGYPDASEALVKDIIKDGPKSVTYTQVVEWLSKKLSKLDNLDDHVNSITSQDDSSSFLLETSSFLKELGCQYKCLIEGHVNERLRSSNDRLLLLDYLATELMAAQIIAVTNSESSTLRESPAAKDLKNASITLEISVPESLPLVELLAEIQKKIDEVLQKAPEDLTDKPLFTGEVSSEQWERIEEVLSELQSEYKTRREMLLKRLDVTVQSFMWSERMVGKEENIASIYYPVRQILNAEPNVELANILSAGGDIAILDKTSSLNVRTGTQSSVNKVVIGHVPDRGGRPNEQQAPPPEMPSWTQRSSGGGFSGRGGHGFRGQGGGGGGHRGRGGGGGWNRGRDNHNKGDRESGHDHRHKSKHNNNGYFLSERDQRKY